MVYWDIDWLIVLGVLIDVEWGVEGGYWFVSGYI